MILTRFLPLDNHTPSPTTEDSLALTVAETKDSVADIAGSPVKGQWIKKIKKLQELCCLCSVYLEQAPSWQTVCRPLQLVSSAPPRVSFIVLFTIPGIEVLAPSLGNSIVPIFIAILVVLVFSSLYIVHT